MALPEQNLLLCDGELLVLTPGYQLIERLGAFHGLPDALSRISLTSKQVLLGTAGAVYIFDANSLQISKTTADLVPISRIEIPQGLLSADSVSWQQFVLDLHSGALFGGVGRWVVDVFGVLAIFMAISGLVMWRK